jgi:hypothetical protein
LIQNGYEEEKKQGESAEREYQTFTKVLFNVLTTYIKQQGKSKVEIGTMIGGMKEDIR